MNGRYASASYKETREIGRRLGALLSSRPGGAVVAMTGDLGAGKTAFAGGMAEGLGVTARVTSPTFTIVNEYHGAKRFCHFDMYRLSGPEELESIGWFDYLDNNTVCAVEWSEKAIDLMPNDCIRVHIAPGEDENDRIITIENIEPTE